MSPNKLFWFVSSDEILWYLISLQQHFLYGDDFDLKQQYPRNITP